MADAIWTTQLGTRIPIGKMSDSHLLNTHRMLCGKMDEFHVMRTTNLDMPMSDKLKAIAWADHEWVVLMKCEYKERDLKPLIVMRDPLWGMWAEPVITIGGYDSLCVTDIDDEALLALYCQMINSRETVFGYMRGSGPQGDAAQDAFDAEFKLAMEFEIQSINHMRHVKGIVDRRGLVVEAEES